MLNRSKSFLIKTIQRTVAKCITKGIVFSGPFKGMLYIDRAHMSAFYPKLLGTYEMELYAVIDKIIKSNPKKLISIGSAEGYYAVGIARLLPECEVVSFDSSIEANKMLTKLANLNGVLPRIKSEGSCDLDTLQKAINNSIDISLIVDIEGEEEKILKPHLIPTLQKARILVEVHEYASVNLTSTLKNRFADTHNIDEILSRDRTFEDFPFRFPISLRNTFLGRSLKLMLDEQRVDGKIWLYLEPKIP